MRAAAGLLVILAAPGAAQWPGDQAIPAVHYPVLPAQAATIEQLVPDGWQIEARAVGDLNRDKRADAAVVLHMNDARNRISPSWNPAVKYDTNPRMLVVAFARSGGGYELAAANHKLIPRLENPNQDDPFDEVAIVGGTLRIKMHLFLSAGGWQMGGSAFTFRWQDGGFKLIGFERDSVMRNSGATEEVSINYLTARKQLKTGNIGSDKQRSRWVRLKRKPLLALAEVGDGLMFDPDER